MPFNTALSAGQITQVRQTEQWFEHYLLKNPNDIVWQAQVNEVLSAVNYAEFEWTTTLQGNRANVIVGQVVLITTSTTDFSEPVIRGRVRAAPGATTFYINEVGTNIDTTMYLTVFDDFDLVEKTQRVGIDSTLYKDYNITYQNLPPTIDGLQSVYADLTGAATVQWAFAPTATAHASGATISTWLWAIGDGSFIVGNSGTQNITAQFPGAATNEHRWVHLTVTDSNGRSTAFHFEVYTVNKNSSVAVLLDSGQYRISGSLQDGWNAECVVWDNAAITDIMDETRVTLAAITDYNGTQTPITSNILLVGRFRREVGKSEPDEKAGLTSEVAFTIEGFAAQLARLPAPSVYIVDNGSPDAWGEINNPTPIRAIVYFLAFHTTFLNLCSFSSDDLSAFIFGDLSLGETNALDNINKQADSVNAWTYFAPSGECTIRRKVSYLTSRGSVTTIHGFTTADIRQITGLNLEYGDTVGQVEAGGVSYNTTRNEIAYRYIARAPAESFGSGYETALLNGQILTADGTETATRTEIAARAGNHLAYQNPKARLSVLLMDGFHFLYPNLYQRYTHTLAATDSTRGRVYTTSDYWQLVSLSITLDTEHNAQEISADFEAETTGGNAGVSVSLIPDVNALDYDLPGIGGYDSFPMDPLVNYPTDSATGLYFEGQLDALQPTPPAIGQNQNVGEETFNVAMWYSQTRNTTRATTLGATYVVTVEGDAEIGTVWSESFAFQGTTDGWTIEVGTQAAGGINTQDVTGGGIARRRISLIRNFAASTLTDINYTYDLTKGTFDPATAICRQIEINAVAVATSDGASSADGTDLTFSWQGSQAASTDIRMILNSSRVPDPPGGYSGSALMETARVQGTGTNPFGDSGNRGDAFYIGYDAGAGAAQLYAVGRGLLVDSIKPTTIPPYNGMHRYEFTVVGTGAVMAFTYNDSNYADNQQRVLRVTIRGANMGPTP